VLEADRQQVERVRALADDVLGGDVVGAYLFGSAVLGELRPDSDLDVLAVSRRATTHEDRRRIVERLLAISGRAGRRVELTIVVQSEVRPWRYPPRMDFQYGDWLRGEFERGNLEPWPSRTNRDLATLITMVLLADTPLLGPPPADVLDAVPPGDLRRGMVEDLDSLLAELEPDTRNVLLTLARIWSTAESGVIRSKDAAADWALERLPDEHRAALAHARAIYLGEAEERWDGLAARVRPCADFIAGEIR
jgi:streptomycin 3"-adenylyltransferase